MKIDRWRIFQSFKYAVYLLLAINVYVFFAEESDAASVQFPDGIGLGDLVQAYASTIDTAAWVLLLLMFELETCVLDPRHFTRPVSRALHGLRFFCYAFVLYALYGYVASLLALYDVTLAEKLTDLCSLAPGDWRYALDLDEFSAITAANCAQFSSAITFYQLGGLPVLTDVTGLRDIRLLAWLDVINAAVWILVVLVLEFDVRMQERGRVRSHMLKLSNAIKPLLYAILFLAAVYWGFKGDFVDFWDAFLWLVAFFFIEMNVIEWRQETREQQAAAVA